MSTFFLTAKHDMHIAHGNDIKKGDKFEVYVGKPFINSANIFNNPESRASIIRQLSNRDIDLVANRKEYFLSGGHFQVEERRNVIGNHF